MRKLILVASAAILLIGPVGVAAAKGGPGGGGGHGGGGPGGGHGGGGPGGGGGGGHGNPHGGGEGGSSGGGHGRGHEGGGPSANLGGGRGGGHHGGGHEANRRGGGPRAHHEQVAGRGHKAEHFAGPPGKARGPAMAEARGRGPAVLVDRTQPARVVIAGREHLRWQPAFQPGCPPGLAKKNNGCLPPGIAKKIYGDPWFRYAPFYGWAGSNDWWYTNGYAYRLDPGTGLVNSFLPLLGGGLFPGNAWPSAYTDYAIDPYYRRYYGYGDYDYRYADGTLFAVDPGTQQINSIAALLTGDPWAVGQPMPPGYYAYNVPPPYRARYYDTPDVWYRYSDGYIYRVDPTTQLVSAVISLLA
jgi:hypothetical protein